MKFNDSDFKFEWYSGTGKGGQHRNKHQNCCRCIHLPTGIKANGSSDRSRLANQRNALAVCKSRVTAHFHQDTERFRATDERVRTYHAVDNRVVDHASGETDTYDRVVTKSNIGPMIEARIKAVRNEA